MQLLILREGGCSFCVVLEKREYLGRASTNGGGLFRFQLCKHKLNMCPWMFRCDRILWTGKGLRQLNYVTVNSQLSDHRPVTAKIIADVEAISQAKLKRTCRPRRVCKHGRKRCKSFN